MRPRLISKRVVRQASAAALAALLVVLIVSCSVITPDQCWADAAMFSKDSYPAREADSTLHVERRLERKEEPEVRIPRIPHSKYQHLHVWARNGGVTLHCGWILP